MAKTEAAIFTNICMIYDNRGNVLVEDRSSTNWPGITFPGGHVEFGESFTDAAIREVREETGLTVSHLRLCGIQDAVQDDGVRYIAYFYKTNVFSGELNSSDEGKVFWTQLDELPNMKLSDGFKEMLRIFLEDDLSEQFFHRKNGVWTEEFK